jgi:uncharacterized protein
MQQPVFSSRLWATRPLEARIPFVPPSRKGDARPLLADKDGVFEGYASIFGLMDLGHDVVMPGAFAASLRVSGAQGVKLLWQHDPRQSIGVWQALVEDGRGLHVRGKLDLASRKGREAQRLIAMGALDGLSIGYRTQKARSDPETGLRRLERVDLIEISLVTYPLLPQARISKTRNSRPISPTMNP